MIFVSGMVGWDAEGKFVSNEFVGQARQALKNIVEILAEAKAKPEHITRLTCYIIDKKEKFQPGRNRSKSSNSGLNLTAHERDTLSFVL
jgi:enamine deaminase RidA (YjgF/YER057c/UK114 family)